MWGFTCFLFKGNTVIENTIFCLFIIKMQLLVSSLGSRSPNMTHKPLKTSALSTYSTLLKPFRVLCHSGFVKPGGRRSVFLVEDSLRVPSCVCMLSILRRARRFVHFLNTFPFLFCFQQTQESRFTWTFWSVRCRTWGTVAWLISRNRSNCSRQTIKRCFNDCQSYRNNIWISRQITEKTSTDADLIK